MDLILLLDKPSGITSNRALQRVKQLFHVKKIGHTGTLDLLATGLLPICFGEATKFSQFLLNADKIYYVKGRLGIRTASGDSESQVISKRHVPKITKRLLEKILSQFRCVINQVPSMYSALKYKGQPLYKLARQGVEIERKLRQVSIYELALLKYDNESIELYVHCSKGTYIRTLIDDVGEALGCGAHVVILRRIGVAHYREDQMIQLAHLEREYDEANYKILNRYLYPLETMVSHFPAIKLPNSVAFYLQQGQVVIVPQAPISGFVQLYDLNNRFFGVGEVLSGSRIAPRQLLKNE